MTDLTAVARLADRVLADIATDDARELQRQIVKLLVDAREVRTARVQLELARTAIESARRVLAEHPPIFDPILEVQPT